MRGSWLAILALVIAESAGAEEGAAFLKLGVGARALGMGGAFTALADDASGIAWNPAGLSRLSRRELGATHADLPEGARYDFVGYAHPTAKGTFAGSAAYLTQGAIEGRDEQGKPTGSFTATDVAASFGYAARLAGPVGLGGAIKLIRGAIAEESAQTVAFDAGGQYRMGNATLGLAVQNVGPGLRYADRTSSLPTTVAAGASYRLPVGLTVAVDAKTRTESRRTEFAVGTEYALVSSFAVRGGYGSSRSSNGAGLSAVQGLAAGFGLKAFGYSLDYSMTPFGDIGNVQRVSLGARF